MISQGYCDDQLRYFSRLTYFFFFHTWVQGHFKHLWCWEVYILQKVGFADSGTALCIDQTFMNFIKVLLSNGACIVSPSSAEFHHSLSKSMLDFVHSKHNFKINTGFVNLKPSTADDQLQYLPLESHTLTWVRLSNTQKSESVSWTKFSINALRNLTLHWLVLQDNWDEVKVWKP